MFMKVHCGGCIFHIHADTNQKTFKHIFDRWWVFAVWQFFQGTCHTYFGSNLETFKVHNRDRLPLIPDEATISEQEFNIVFWVNISHTQENVWKCGDEEERLLHNYYSMWIGRREGTTLEKERKKRYLCLTLRRPKARFPKRTKNLLLAESYFYIISL